MLDEEAQVSRVEEGSFYCSIYLFVLQVSMKLKTQTM